MCREDSGSSSSIMILQQGNDLPCIDLKRGLSLLTGLKFMEIMCWLFPVSSNVHALHLSLQLFAVVAVAEIQLFSSEVLMWSTRVSEGPFLLLRSMFLSENAIA